MDSSIPQGNIKVGHSRKFFFSKEQKYRVHYPGNEQGEGNISQRDAQRV
jgi:hypothetical protein